MLKQEIEDGTRSFADPAFRADVIDGLTRRPRAIPARWFYDRRGSELFEAITDLPEYYPTRTETALLQGQGRRDRGAGRAGPRGGRIRIGLVDQDADPARRRSRPSAYVPIDISGDFLRESSKALAAAFPDLPVLPLEADFLQPLHLPAAIARLPKLGFFPGSTIGNMIPCLVGRPAPRDARLARRRRDAVDRDGPDQGRGRARTRL